MYLPYLPFRYEKELIRIGSRVLREKVLLWSGGRQSVCLEKQKKIQNIDIQCESFGKQTACDHFGHFPEEYNHTEEIGREGIEEVNA